MSNRGQSIYITFTPGNRNGIKTHLHKKCIFSKIRIGHLKPTQLAARLNSTSKVSKLYNSCLPLTAWWVAYVGCPRTHPCAAAGHLMGRSAVGGAGVNVASASAWPQSQESSTVLAASAMTGCVPHLMGKPAMVRTANHKMTRWTNMCRKM